MNPQEFSEKLSEILSSLDEIAQAGEKVQAQMQAEDQIVIQHKVDAVRCSCGLIMSGSNFYEHMKETRHNPLQTEPYLNKRRPEAGNVKKDQKETPRKTKQKTPKMSKSAPKRVEPALHFSFSNLRAFDEL